MGCTMYWYDDSEGYAMTGGDSAIGWSKSRMLESNRDESAVKNK